MKQIVISNLLLQCLQYESFFIRSFYEKKHSCILKKTDYPVNPVFSIFEIRYSGNLHLISQKTICINLKITQFTVNSNSTAWKNYMADKIWKVLKITKVIYPCHCWCTLPGICTDYLSVSQLCDICNFLYKLLSTHNVAAQNSHG